jgi:hypothetical protein
MKFNFLFIILFFNITFGQSQENQGFCTSNIPSDAWEEAFQKLIANSELARSTTTAYQIPVIFHIIHGGENVGVFPNITSQQVNSQIAVLNQDYTGTGLNVNNYPTNAFVNWAINQAIPAANLDILGRIKIANSEIQFCLAQVNASGVALAEPGIERINYIERGWQNPNVFATNQTLRDFIDNIVKPQSIWDATKYLNIWVTDKSASLNARGFATPPPLSGLAGIPISATTSLNDGVWCYAMSVGSYQIYPAGIYDNTDVSGRLLTHEIGHWLGLRHIWGDGNCFTDYCNDTPSQADPSSGNPTYPQGVGSCSTPSNVPNGEMFMNFMDYTANPSMYMFTTDQVTRMQTAMANSPQRNQMGTHGICNTLALNDQALATTIKLYPNPTNDILTIEDQNNSINYLEIYTLLGQKIATTTHKTLSLQSTAAGMYLLKLYFNNNTTQVIKIIKK